MNKLSIITINYNNRNGLSRTLESVFSQASCDFEYIIIDGASTDGSKELIGNYADKDKRLSYWISEADTGIYNAMNKGIAQAKGEYLLFLNSGDWLYDDKVIGDFIALDYQDDFISGAILLMEEKPMVRKAVCKQELAFEHLYHNVISHPTTFIKKELFIKYGLYNENYKIVSDWEFFLKCLVINNCSYTHWDRIVACFDMTGISSEEKYSQLLNNEREAVFMTQMPRLYLSYQKLETAYLGMKDIELKHSEYEHLKNGKLGGLIKLIIYLKAILK